jgi:hypothetical protein
LLLRPGSARPSIHYRLQYRVKFRLGLEANAWNIGQAHETALDRNAIREAAGRPEHIRVGFIAAKMQPGGDVERLSVPLITDLWERGVKSISRDCAEAGKRAIPKSTARASLGREPTSLRWRCYVMDASKGANSVSDATRSCISPMLLMR